MYQCLLPFRCMIQRLSIYLFFCGRKGIPIPDSIQGIYKRKLCRLRCRVVIQCKRNNGDSCFLMLCLLCVSDELNRKPKSSDNIALTATVLSVYGSTRQKALVFAREGQEFTFTEEKARRKLISQVVAENQLLR